MVAMSDEYDVVEFVGKMPQGMGALNAKMGIELVEISPERVVATMPVEGNTQPYGLLHGGASVVLAETLGSVGSALHAMPDRLSVGVDINATHHRAVASGTVVGVATPLHLGRSVACYEVVISDEEGRRVCTARITCNLVARRAGDVSDRGGTTP
jgi:1,4-dihydroxy-2-naphthoyl-CoA hydrolase